jgi:Tfp pilus assembly protein PilV
MLSLAETLVASSILATALLSLAQLFALGVSATDAAGRMTQAALFAAQKIEDVRASSADALDGGGSDAPASGFRREWTISALPSDPDHVILIEVVVSVRGSTTRIVALRGRNVP